MIPDLPNTVRISVQKQCCEQLIYLQGLSSVRSLQTGRKIINLLKWLHMCGIFWPLISTELLYKRKIPSEAFHLNNDPLFYDSARHIFCDNADPWELQVSPKAKASKGKQRKEGRLADEESAAAGSKKERSQLSLQQSIKHAGEVAASITEAAAEGKFAKEPEENDVKGPAKRKSKASKGDKAKPAAAEQPAVPKAGGTCQFFLPQEKLLCQVQVVRLKV